LSPLSEAVISDIRNLSAGVAPIPSASALESFIGELELEVRNNEFRMHYLYYQHHHSLEMLADVKRHARTKK
jgi:hypothetical protein